MICHCGRTMHVAGTAGQGLGNIMGCGCGNRQFSDRAATNAFQAQLLRERAASADPERAERLRISRL